MLKSIALPTAFSKGYVEDISDQIVNISKPDGVLVHPHERFFAGRTVPAENLGILKESEKICEDL